MIAKNLSKNCIIANNCTVANTFLKRFIGLMGQDSLPPESALLLAPCNSIHMFFMKFSLDIIFLDKDNNVVHLIEHIRPWRISKLVIRASAVIELPAGIIQSTNTHIGDVIKLSD